jgi:hypothetical protein
LSRAEEIARKAAGLGRATERPTGTGKAQQVTKVRRTVDLSPQDHRRLNAMCDAAAAELGRGKVFSQDALEGIVRFALVHFERGEGVTRERLLESIADVIAEKPPRRRSE